MNNGINVSFVCRQALAAVVENAEKEAGIRLQAYPGKVTSPKGDV
jgi:hypothetical protein